MVGLFLQSSWESDRVEDTGEYIEVTLDSGDWLKVAFNLTVFSFFASKGQCLDCFRSVNYVFNSFIACSHFLDPDDEIAAGEYTESDLSPPIPPFGRILAACL